MIERWTYSRYVTVRGETRLYPTRHLTPGTGRNHMKGKRRTWLAGRRKGNRGHCGGYGQVGHNVLTCAEVKR